MARIGGKGRIALLAIALAGGALGLLRVRRVLRQPTALRLAGQRAPSGGIWIDALGPGLPAQWGGGPSSPRKEARRRLRLEGIDYAHGLAAGAPNDLQLELREGAAEFEALVGVQERRLGQVGRILSFFDLWDPRLDRGPAARFEVWVDGRLAAESPPMRQGDAPHRFEVDLHGARDLVLVAGRTGAGAGKLTGVWGGAHLLPLSRGSAPLIVDPAAEVPPLAPFEPVSRAPQLPVRRTERPTRGRALAQTPPMGWNSWNVWGSTVTAARVREAADTLVRSGLASRGYRYVVVDDGWAAGRSAAGDIVPSAAFGDVRALSEYVHSRGLRFGLYSSPAPRTCGGFEGSYGHEERDARTFARWGVDYLKYDWCGYDRQLGNRPGSDPRGPYAKMHQALRRSGRDIVYSLCQYGQADVWEWGREVGGNLWRTTTDLHDDWPSLEQIGFSQSDLAPFAGPGRWNDPDMLVVGRVGWGKGARPTRLTPNEQVTHVTLWCMLAAPLMLGCDLSRLDPFTLALVGNEEVIAVDQDPAGRAGRRVRRSGPTEVWSRPLADGTLAVGLFNRGVVSTGVTAAWTDLGLTGSQPVRDLWRRRNLGVRAGSITLRLGRHGAALLKVGRPRRSVASFAPHRTSRTAPALQAAG
jgi:alpha-galactosidase